MVIEEKLLTQLPDGTPLYSSTNTEENLLDQSARTLLFQIAFGAAGVFDSNDTVNSYRALL